ncbi:MAG: hypothetical protein E7678_00495 [Ruminococcaceae bacterium]|nr:hypothetical protein [Oscillospiraceae bacterium]
MKKFIRLICICLIAVMLFLNLFSCASEEEGGGESNSESSSEEVVEIVDNYDGVFPILKNGQYIVKVVMPDLPRDSEKAVYTKLRTSLAGKTSVKVDSYTDYLKDGESRDKNEYVILVGETNYTESASVYNRTKANSYGVQIVNKTRMVVYFSTESEGLKAVSALISAINTDNAGYFWIDGTFSTDKTMNFKLETVPNYPTSTSKHDCGDDTTMLVAQKTNLSTFETYCNTLKSSGFAEYSKRDNINGNYYRIYTKGTMALNVYFTKSTSTVRIISGPLDDIPTKEVDRTPEKNKKVSLTMLSQGEDTDCGLCLIIHLPNGKFMIFDGGFSLWDKLYKKLIELSPKGERITVAAWFVSHPHNDHQDGVTYFIKQHSSSVKVENVFYNYATADYYKNTTQETNSTGLSGVKDELDSILNINLKRTSKVIKPHTGQVYNFGSASAEILYTVEDIMPSKLDYVNSSSLVVRISVAGQTILALADATHSVSTILQNTYGSYLKSDIVQLAHHGTYPGHASLYTKIGATTLLWPSNTANAKTFYSNDAVKEALAKAKDVYLSKDVDATLLLPYTLKNNKSQFLKSIGK